MSLFWKEKNKGSLTVEACIALPVFLCFFYLLLFFVKIACVNIILDHAAKETAQQVAAVSYPLRYLNDYIDLKVDDGADFKQFFNNEFVKVQDVCLDKVKSSSITDIISGKFEKFNINQSLKEIGGMANDDFNVELESLIAEALLPAYIDLKESGQYYLASELYSKYSKNSYINKNKLSVSLFEIPQSAAEYKYKKSIKWYEDSGLKPDIDFDYNDVVVQIEYKFDVPLPFFGKKDIVLRHTAVEKAWLYGSNGIYTASAETGEKSVEQDNCSEKKEEEKKDPEEKQDEKIQYVYVCKSNTNVYHKYYFCSYLKDSCFLMTLEEAQRKGMRPHGGCPYRFK